MPAYPDKYLTLLDHEVLAYVDGVLDAYPADAVEATIEQQRQFYEAMCRRFAGTSPANVASVDTELLALSGPRNPYAASGKLGVIEVGAAADILLVDGNPLEDISVLGGNQQWFDADPEYLEIETLKIIMKDGVIYKNSL